MTIRHMKIFLQVYQTQNITRAAEIMHMTQPAVTRSIQEIEAYYGVCLFERINRRLFVTESGKQLYAQALHIVDSFDMMEKGLRNWDSFGVLRVGASITLGNYLLPELVCQFQKQRPNIQVQVTVANGAILQKALLVNQLDIALLEGGVSEPELQTEVFEKDHLVLIVSPSHPLLTQEKIVLKDLLPYHFLLREKGSVGRTFLDNVFAIRGITLHPLWESASTQAIVKAVGYGIGLSILPEQLVCSDITAGTIGTREIMDESFDRLNYLVWHKNKYLTTAAQEFIALCKKTRD
ncbi:MAG: LysR family transcriptional regulator [Anaerocolumna sp.]